MMDGYFRDTTLGAGARRLVSCRHPNHAFSEELSMGKGDRKTTRGKTFRGSYGNSRPHKEKTVVVTKAVATSKPAVKKAAPKKKTAA